jgi:hypothetical protein
VINLRSLVLSGEVEEMITMKQLGKIRRLYYRDGLTMSEIERRRA